MPNIDGFDALTTTSLFMRDIDVYIQAALAEELGIIRDESAP